jgi:hypothetical protein
MIHWAHRIEFARKHSRSTTTAQMQRNLIVQRLTRMRMTLSGGIDRFRAHNVAVVVVVVIVRIEYCVMVNVDHFVVANYFVAIILVMMMMLFTTQLAKIDVQVIVERVGSIRGGWNGRWAVGGRGRLTAQFWLVRHGRYIVFEWLGVVEARCWYGYVVWKLADVVVVVVIHSHSCFDKFHWLVFGYFEGLYIFCFD